MAHIIGTPGDDRGAAALHGTATDDLIEGLAGRDDLYGNDGNDVLDGGGDADRMFGGNGNDTYYVDNVGDVVTELAGQGNDTVISSRLYALGANVERLTLTGTGNISGTGNSLNNVIAGNDGNNYLKGGDGNDALAGGLGNDTLDGGKGADILKGGAGDDRYYVENTGDTITEYSNSGNDTVLANINYTLGFNVENLILTGSNNRSGAGNALDNMITGNSGDNLLHGGDGNDVINGGAGLDTLYGGTGDDVFYVDNAGDKVIEYGDQGHDSVISSISLVLAGNVEDLTLSGAATIDATGNILDNTLTGNSGNNVLDGKAGVDIMLGGGGNDTYVVDNPNDVVTEMAGEGNDTVQASLSYTLGANIENLTLTTSASIDGTGNDLDNTLIGNGGANILTGGAGNDWLDGGAGVDILVGGTGDDTYVISSVHDVVTELAGEGSDTVQSAVNWTLSDNLENLTLTGKAVIGAGNDSDNVITGNAAANTLWGMDGNDHIDGGAGNDSLDGGKGDDVLTGGAGADIFTFVQGGIGTETVTDFSVAQNDMINIVAKTINPVPTLTRNGADVTISLAGGGTILLANETASDADILSHFTINGQSVVFGTNSSDNLSATVKGAVLFGGAGDDVLHGNTGNDILDGGTGADTMYGSNGVDTFFVDNAGDVIGDSNISWFLNDTVVASVDYTLSGMLGKLVLTGTADLSGTGNISDNTFVGNAGNNHFYGAGGFDTVDYSGATSDLMVNLGYPAGTVTGADVGTDTLDRIQGIIGGSGNDVMTASINSGRVKFDGGAGDDVLTGGNQADTLIGGAGNNIIDGGAGADVMRGGAGDDIFYVDNHYDVVQGGGGHDIIYCSVSYNVSGTAVLQLTGYAGLSANGSSNVATPTTLIGNIGGNTLNGGAGSDTLTGGLGADTFLYTLSEIQTEVITDFSTAQGDIINILHTDLHTQITFSQQGADTLIDFGGGHTILVENMTATDPTFLSWVQLNGQPINGRFFGGGAGADHLTGTAGNDILDGGAGADIMEGGSGSDSYYVDNSGDIVIEHSNEPGIDTIYASVSYGAGVDSDGYDNVVLTGTADIDAIGNTINNVLTSNSGHNVLTGGAGADTFVFLTASGADTIADFSATQNDRIDLHAYNAEATAVITQSGADTVIDLGGGNLITVSNATTSDVEAHIVW